MAMTQPRVDLSGRRWTGKPSRADLALLVTAMAMLLLTVHQWRQANQARLKLEAASVSLNASRPTEAPQAHVQPAPPLSAAQAGALNQAIGKLNLPWPELFEALNASIPGKVALLTIRPDASRQNLRLTAETDKVEEMMHCIQMLKQHPSFDGVRLLRSQIDDKDPMHPMRFEIQLHWRQPAGVRP